LLKPRQSFGITLYLLDLRKSVAEKLPVDDTLMPKRVGVGT
jgi:hypothetical protein